MVVPAERTARVGDAARGIRGFVWRAWPWMNGLLPALVCFHGWLFGNAGWETLILSVGAVIIVPALALLASVPRFILRKRGCTTAPGPIPWLLFVQWWGLFTIAGSIPGTTDVEPLPALLESMTPGGWQPGFGRGILAAAVGATIIAWAAVTLLAATVRPTRGERGGAWTPVTWAAAFAVPAVLVAALSAAAVGNASATDAAGETAAEVAQKPVDAQAEIMLQRYDEAQRVLSGVRGLIAADGWHATGGGFSTAPPWSGAADGYVFEASFFVEPETAPDFDADEVRRILVADGWRWDDTGRAAVDDAGNRVTVAVEGDDRIFVELTSAFWWGDAHDLVQELGRDRAPWSGTHVFADDEWPPLV